MKVKNSKIDITNDVQNNNKNIEIYLNLDNLNLVISVQTVNLLYEIF